MVRLNAQIKLKTSTHLGGGYLNNPTLNRRNKHEIILEK